MIINQPRTCDKCLEKQNRMFSRDSQRVGKCRICRESHSTREHEEICDECSEEHNVCRGCEKSMD